jgi:hypothetical protein
MFFSSMHPSWQARLSASKDLLTEIEAQLISEQQITPPPALVMRAFQEPFESVKVLLVAKIPIPPKMLPAAWHLRCPIQAGNLKV